MIVDVEEFSNFDKCESCGSFVQSDLAEVLKYSKQELFFCSDRCVTEWFTGGKNVEIPS